MKNAAFIGLSRHRTFTDGEGITTLAAFHGCTLHCRYCLTPQCLMSDYSGQEFSCEELYESVKQDELYFLATGGGITFGGGEPCLQSDFICRFRQLCGTKWKISLETALNVDRSHLEKLLPVVDSYYIDIKDMNCERYRRYTGRSNRKVINNLQWLIAQGKAPQIVIRVPLIPSYNTEDDREDSVRQLKEMPRWKPGKQNGVCVDVKYTLPITFKLKK
jgi:pyruvate formate lyase activating enzyme